MKNHLLSSRSTCILLSFCCKNMNGCAILCKKILIISMTKRRESRALIRHALAYLFLPVELAPARNLMFRKFLLRSRVSVGKVKRGLFHNKERSFNSEELGTLMRAIISAF